MAETYCGKICAECAQRESMNCPGCKTGPGRPYGGDCELALCARSKGHETCDSCVFRDTCGPLKGREHMIDYRNRRIEAEKARKAAIAKRAPVLGKWLWVIFWLVIPSAIAGVMTNESVVKLDPALYMPGQILNAVVAAVYGVSLLKLGAVEDRYRTAGICTLVAGGISTLISLITGTAQPPVATLLLSVPAAVVSFVGVYNEYMAHSTVLVGVDNELSEKWEKLWKWYIGLFCAMMGSLLVLLIIPILGALVILAAAIGVIVVSVLNLVYLYRTAKIFRQYPVDA